jgi:hypothetical protein
VIPNEQLVIEHFTEVRWKRGAFYPLGGSTKVYYFFERRILQCGDSSIGG